MICRNCGEDMEGDGYSRVIRCPEVDPSIIEPLEPDANPQYCTDHKDKECLDWVIEYIYVHRFKVSSGKEHKEITKVYYSGGIALENHRLLGGYLLLTKVVFHYK